MTDISKKQYLLSSCKLTLDGMQEHKISDVYLYTDAKLGVSKCETASGKSAVILGSAFCTDIDGKRAEEDITAFDGECIENATAYWTGRWTLITETELITDASGLMGAFYSVKESGWIISSSPALVAKIMDIRTDGVVKPDGISWNILPNSVAYGIKSLICTQKIAFGQFGLRILSKKHFKDYRELSTSDKCVAVADMLVNAAKNISKYSGKRIKLALTGGKDSRLTFSALIKSGVPFACYTSGHNNMSSSDKTVPKKLCEAFGIEYSFVKSNPMDNNRLADYYNFCAGNSNGVDALFYARGQFSPFDEDDIVIRSGLFEAGQTYARSYTSSDIDDFEKSMTAYYSDLRTNEVQRSAFVEWLKNAKENPIDFIDIRDRFYIEQRVGGWAAAIEQSLDINDFTSIQIANCAELLSVLLSCNDDERRTLALSYETIKKLEPKTLDLPVNQRSFYDKLVRLKGIVKNPISKIKKYIHKRKR